MWIKRRDSRGEMRYGAWRRFAGECRLSRQGTIGGRGLGVLCSALVIVAGLPAGLACGQDDNAVTQVQTDWWGEQLPRAGDGRWLRLGVASNRAGGRPRQWLGVRNGKPALVIGGVLADQRSTWFARSLGDQLVRFEHVQGRQVQALTAAPGGKVQLAPPSADLGQLWRPVSTSGGWYIYNVGYPTLVLAGANGGLSLLPWVPAAPYVWLPSFIGPPPAVGPVIRSIDTQIIPDPPLPPAHIELANSHRDELLVLIGDSRAPNRVESVAIPPNETVELVVDRPSGATLIEVVELWSPVVGWERKSFRTKIPSAYLLDFSVYTKHLQSIAIDRTGKSPSVIEDVNYVPKSVGWFSVTIDESFPDQVQLDVYKQARDANNPGAVRRLDPRAFDEDADEAESPTERALKKYQDLPRRKF